MNRYICVGNFSPRRGLVLRLMVSILSLTVLFFVLLPLPAGVGLAAGPDGAVDPTFRSGSGPGSPVNSVAIQSDDKIVIGGDFTTYNNVQTNHVLRLNSDGSPDTTFNSGTGADNNVQSVVIQSDGKILLGGDFTSYNGTPRPGVARLNSDGSLDTAFGSLAGVNSNATVYTIVAQPDGKILLGGSFNSYNGAAVNRVARLNSDGSLDTSFNPGTGASGGNAVRSLVVQSDGKILLGGDFTSYGGTSVSGIVRLNSDGSLDTSFNPGSGTDSGVRTLALQGDGKILLGGGFTSYNGTLRYSIARLNSDGSLDTNFIPGSWAYGGVHTLVAQSDGKILIGGYFTGTRSNPVRRVARLHSNGNLDFNFSTRSGANGAVTSLAIQSDSKVLIGGYFTEYKNTTISRVARLNTDAALDSSFQPGLYTGVNYSVYKIRTQNDGKILIAGLFARYNNIVRKTIARLNSDGSLDTSFDPGAAVGENRVDTLCPQPDGKILIAGYFASYNGTSRYGIARLNTDGSLDTSFNSGSGLTMGMVNEMVIQSEGKILIVGNFSDYNGTSVSGIARLNSDGSLDTSFNPEIGLGSSFRAITLQNDGKILVGGYFTYPDGTGHYKIARLNADGSLDTPFHGAAIGSGPTGTLVIASQSDGKVVIGGDFTSYDGTAISGVARLNADGSLDTAFGSTGSTTFSSIVYSVAVQKDGKTLIGGYFSSYNGIKVNNIARLNGDGSLDTSFDAKLAAELDMSVYSMLVQYDGKVLIGGYFSSVGGYPRNGIARLESSGGAFSSVSLSSSANPAPVGQPVTFTATVAPLTASGVVTFSLDGITAGSSPLVNGQATYTTNTLSGGTHVVTAAYSGDARSPGSNSALYTQLVTAPCVPRVVTRLADDGRASSCGSFSYALATITQGTISFALASGSTISFTGNLTPTLRAGVALDGGPNGIVLDGNGLAGDGLRLAGNNTLTNLTVRNFGGREIVSVPGENVSHFYRVRVES